MIKLHEVPPEPVDPASLPHDVNAHSPEGDGNPDKRKNIWHSVSFFQEFMSEIPLELSKDFGTAHGIVFPTTCSKYINHAGSIT